MIQFPFSISSSQLVAKTLKSEGVICFPTETVYGLGGNALSKKVVEEVFAIKRRPTEKSLSVLVNQEWIPKLTCWEDNKVDRIMNAFWPGPLTLVLHAQPELPDYLKSPKGTIAIRWSSSLIVQELIKLGGYPLIGTSANLSGMPACLNPVDVKKQFGETTPMLVNAGILPENIPTSLLDCTQNPFKMLRSGGIDKHHIEDFL